MNDHFPRPSVSVQQKLVDQIGMSEGRRANPRILPTEDAVGGGVTTVREASDMSELQFIITLGPIIVGPPTINEAEERYEFPTGSLRLGASIVGGQLVIGADILEDDEPQWTTPTEACETAASIEGGVQSGPSGLQPLWDFVLTDGDGPLTSGEGEVLTTGGVDAYLRSDQEMFYKILTVDDAIAVGAVKTIFGVLYQGGIDMSMYEVLDSALVDGEDVLTDGESVLYAGV